MKLSCSAYQAGSCSYAQKILSSHPHPQNYGATSSTNPSGDSSHGITMPTWNVEEIEGKCSPNETEFGAEVSGGYQQGQQGGSRQSADGGGGSGGGAGGSGVFGRGESSRRTSSSLSHHSADGHADDRRGHRGSDSATSISKAPATSSGCSPSESPAHRLSEHSRSRSKSVGEQQWTNLRAVLAWYARLRRIKRDKSSQRWLKLRTTVQMTSALQPKKPPLKREDSFLKRFSTRQQITDQETFEVGDDEDDGGVDGVGECSKKARARRKRKLPISVVNPDSNFYFYWLFVVSLTCLYNLWGLIVRQSFLELNAKARLFWILSDAFADIVYLLDIVVQFRTGYLEQGLMVYQTRKLAKHYVGSKPFYLDLCSLIPTDLCQLYFGVNPMFRFPRFLKVYRLYNYYYMVESRTVFPNVWRVVNLIHILLLLAHWFGCFYYLISEAEGFQGHWGYPDPKNYSDFAPLTRKYLGSLYWSTLTLTTIGDLPPPHSNWQYIFTIVSYLIGVFIFATIVGQVGNVITNRNANRLEFERLLDGAKTYMRHHKVPRNMQRRVLRWYDYSWSRGRIQGGGDINTALGLLPDKLKTELALHVNLSVLKKVTIFQECQPEFLHDLVLKMKAYIFTPGDLICRKGEVAREMFIIADGILEVISETGKVLTTMEAGNFFGEIGILNLDGLNKRTADVRSVGYSELFSLSREDVLSAMKDYPEAQDILQTLGRKRLMEARKSSGPAVKKVTEPKKGSPNPGVVTSVHNGSTAPQVESDNTARKRIVEKLRSDVKGLRNAIRRSRKSNSSKEDSSETESGAAEKEPSSTGQGKKRKESTVSVHDSTKSFPPPRGVLKRMHNVVLSDEMEPSSPSAATASSIPSLKSVLAAATKRVQLPRGPSLSHPPPAEPTEEIIGAGLPLIQRLRLLRQKDERERKQQEERDALLKTLIPSNISLSSRTPSPTSTHLHQVESHQQQSSSTPASIPPTEVSHHHPFPFSTQFMKGDPRHHQRGSISSNESGGHGSGYSSPSSLPLLGTFSPKSSMLIGEAAAVAVLKVTAAESPRASSGNQPPSTFPPVWTASPPRTISRPKSGRDDDEEVKEDSILLVQQHPAPSERERPSALQLRQQLSSTKNYGSVDDLSPEFSRLPFIKKLKILNERQKIAELLVTKSANSVLTRSTSEGSNENPSIPGEKTAEEQLHSVHHGRRTQSHREGQQIGDEDAVSTDTLLAVQPYIPLDDEGEDDRSEASGKECLTNQPSTSTSSCKRRKRRKVGDRSNKNSGKIPDGNDGSTENSSSSPPPPEDDNETAERRNLKSILKQLAQLGPSIPPSAAAELEEQLLKSQTVHGYAARHLLEQSSNIPQRPTTVGTAPTPTTTTASISSSVVLQSVTQTTTTTTTATVDPNSAFTPENINVITSLLKAVQPSTTTTCTTTELEPTSVNLNLNPFTEGLNFAQEECISSVFLGIKTIIQTKFDEIQSQFQTRFDSLEAEVGRRDELIGLMQERIEELECRTGGGGGEGGGPLSVRGRIAAILSHNHIDALKRTRDEEEDEEDVEYQRNPLAESSYLFSRGDSIDTVISAAEYFDDDEVFEGPEPHASSSSQQQGQGRRQQTGGGDVGSYSLSHHDPLLMGRSEQGPAPWQLEFHRDRDSLPPPNGNGGRRGVDVTLDMGTTSTSEYDTNSDEEESGVVQLTETKVPLDDDDDEESSYEEDEEDDGFDNKNWEIQLLAKEMEKREEQKKVTTTNTATATVVQEMRELETEIEEMTAVVNKGSLSPSDLDMLESMLQTKTKRMKALVKALSLESGSSPGGGSYTKSKVGRSIDDFRRGSGSSGASGSSVSAGYRPLPSTSAGQTESRFLDVHKLFSRAPSSGTSGKLKRQSSLYERTLKGSYSGGRRESAGAVVMGVAGATQSGKGQQRKSSFLSRFSMVRQLTVSKKGAERQESLEEDASPLQEMARISSKSKKAVKAESKDNTTTTALCSPTRDDSGGGETETGEVVGGSATPSTKKSEGECDTEATRAVESADKLGAEQNFMEECQPLLTK